MTIQATVEASVKKTDAATPAEGARAGAVMAKAVEADPVLMNATNQEPWYQSGTGMFGVGGVLWALGVIAVQVGTHGLEFQSYEYGTMVAALGALASAAGVIYRRFMPGLKPLFSGWFGAK